MVDSPLTPGNPVVNELVERGVENLYNTLDNIGATTLRLFGWRKGPDGWTRDPEPGVPESQVGPSVKDGQREKAARRDKIQWVPNYDAGMPTYNPNKSNGYPVGDNLPGSTGAPLPGVKQEGRVVQRGDWLYKVDGSGRIIWKRLVT